MDKIINLDKMEHSSTKWENLILKGNTYQDYSTLIVIATRGRKEIKLKVPCECPKCGETFEKETKTDVWVGFHPWVVESWKRLLKPMNVPIMEMVISGYEVGEAYCKAIESLLTNPQLSNFKYVLFMEDDVIIPYMPDTFGPLVELYKNLEKFDVASGLYWTKGEPSLPLVYGTGNINEPAPFAVNLDWKAGDVVEVNGCGMGFTLMKRKIFEDRRLSQPYFKSFQQITTTVMKQSTQDLYFYENIKKLGYRICVDTNIKCGHLDVVTETIY